MKIPIPKNEDIFENYIKVYEKIEEEHLQDLKGHFIKFITCQNGSRIMQIALYNSSYIVIEAILNEIENNINELLVDAYANYFIQKFYEFLKLDHRLFFLEKVKIFNYLITFLILIKIIRFKFNKI